MRRIFGKKDIFILFALFLIGFVVHLQSFQMALYGDDWRFIYNYFTHEEMVANFSPFPGILAYLAPYGPSALTIGFLYQIFGRAYYIYYLVPLIFKILTSFVIFLILRNIAKELKKNDTLVSFFPAALFLVGIVGIQAIDWAFHINVYIALFTFVLSLFFQIRFYNDKSYNNQTNLLLGLFLSIFSIMFAPIRLSPLILIIPLIDVTALIKSRDKYLYLIIGLKNIIFAIFLFVFFQVGVFGHSPQDLYSPYPSPLIAFIKEVSAEPIFALKAFLHWIGIMILPTYPASGTTTTSTVGAIFLMILFLIFFQKRSRYIVIGSALFFIPLILMWMITPLRVIDSADRYLPLPFLGLCFLVGMLGIYTGKLKKLFKLLILGVILIQAYSTIKIYSYWISIGRGADFVEKIQAQIMSHFPNPIKESKIIYLDFDNPTVQQSIEFGLGYRVALLSGTIGLEYFPRLMSNKEVLIKVIGDEIEKGRSIDQVVNNLYTFQFKNRKFKDITESFNQELKKELSKAK